MLFRGTETFTAGPLANGLSLHPMIPRYSDDRGIRHRTDGPADAAC